MATASEPIVILSIAKNLVLPCERRKEEAVEQTPEGTWVDLTIVYHVKVKQPKGRNVDRLTDKILERSQRPVFEPERILTWDKDEFEVLGNGVTEGWN